ncbi:hypothetical protein ACWGB8_27730 [Kitasatospora sp. NPDC054939]
MRTDGAAPHSDYNEFIDEYAPIRVNSHLSFDHPATERWNLLHEIRQTEQAFRDADRDGLPHPDTGAEGVLIPALSTDIGFNNEQGRVRRTACVGTGPLGSGDRI